MSNTKVGDYSCGVEDAMSDLLALHGGRAGSTLGSRRATAFSFSPATATRSSTASGMQRHFQHQNASQQQFLQQYPQQQEHLHLQPSSFRRLGLLGGLFTANSSRTSDMDEIAVPIEVGQATGLKRQSSFQPGDSSFRRHSTLAPTFNGNTAAVTNGTELLATGHRSPAASSVSSSYRKAQPTAVLSPQLQLQRTSQSFLLWRGEPHGPMDHSKDRRQSALSASLLPAAEGSQSSSAAGLGKFGTTSAGAPRTLLHLTHLEGGSQGGRGSLSIYNAAAGDSSGGFARFAPPPLAASMASIASSGVAGQNRHDVASGVLTHPSLTHRPGALHPTSSMSPRTLPLAPVTPAVAAAIGQTVRVAGTSVSALFSAGHNSAAELSSGHADSLTLSRMGAVSRGGHSTATGGVAGDSGAALCLGPYVSLRGMHRTANPVDPVVNLSPTTSQKGLAAAAAAVAVAAARNGIHTFETAARQTPDDGRNCRGRGGGGGGGGAAAWDTFRNSSSVACMLPATVDGGGGGGGNLAHSTLYRRSTLDEGLNSATATTTAEAFYPLSCRGTGMRAFHLSWASLLVAFFSAFAPAAMLPVYSEPLHLSKAVIAAAGAASLLAGLIVRLLMVACVRRYGPRYCQALTLLLTAPAIACMALVRHSGGFITARLAISMCLGASVVSNFWVILVFQPSVLGSAIAMCSNWGNAGCGLAMLIMPILYKLMLWMYDGDVDSAWHAVFYFPAGAHLLLGALILLLGQDTPQGDLLDWHADTDSHDRSGSWGRAQQQKQIREGMRRQRRQRKRRQKQQQRKQQEQQQQQREKQLPGDQLQGTHPHGCRNMQLDDDEDGFEKGEKEVRPPPPPPHPPPPPLPSLTSVTDASSPKALDQMHLQFSRTGSASVREWSSSRPFCVGPSDVAAAAAAAVMMVGSEDSKSSTIRSRSPVTPTGASPLLFQIGEAAGSGGIAAVAATPTLVEVPARADMSSSRTGPDDSSGNVGPAGKMRRMFSPIGGNGPPPSPVRPTAPQVIVEAYGCGGQDAVQDPAALAAAVGVAQPRGAVEGQQLQGVIKCTISGRRRQEIPPYNVAIANANANATATLSAAAVTLPVRSQPLAPPPAPPPSHVPSSLQLPLQNSSNAAALVSEAASALPRTFLLSQPRQPGPPHPSSSEAAPSECPSASLPPTPFAVPTLLLPTSATATSPSSPSPGPMVHPRLNSVYDQADDVTAYVEWRRSRMQQHSALGTSWQDAVHLYGIAVRNHRCLLLSLNYGYNYGAQMALYNLLTLYLFQRYGMGFIAAGALAAMPGLLNAVTRICGGALSHAVCRRFGMRGRLWLLWAAQAAGGLCCLLLGLCGGGSSGLIATSILLLMFAVTTQIAAGATYAIIPYVSYRAFAAVTGIISGGGQFGGVLQLLFFFASEHLSYEQGLMWMGVTILATSCTLLLLRFPMWGGMLTGPNTRFGAVLEEDYYLSEWTKEEIDSGVAAPALMFAAHARLQRSGPSKPLDRLSLTHVHV